MKAGTQSNSSVTRSRIQVSRTGRQKRFDVRTNYAAASTESLQRAMTGYHKHLTMANDRPDSLRIEELLQQLGVPRELIWDTETQTLLICCAMEIFCDEVKLPHPGAVVDARLRALFGRQSFEEGSFRQALLKTLAESSSANEPAINALQDLFATILARWALSGRMSYHLPSTNLVDDTLFFDGNEHSHELSRSLRPRTVVDYGPGVGERFILQEHYRAVAAGRPFFYLPVTKGAFVNKFALRYLELLHGQEDLRVYLAKNFYLPQEDGIMAATTRLGASSLSGQCDVVLCSGLQMIDRRELEAGIVNSSLLLRPGGVLLIRAVKERKPPESATADDMLAIAYQAGFSDPLLFHSVTTPRPGESFATLSAILTRS